MNKKYIIAALAVLVSTITFAQPVKKSSYVVIKSDTIYGSFREQNFDNTSSKITFRRTESDPWTVYGPADISAYSLFGVDFESRKLKIDFSSRGISDLMNKQSQGIVKDTTVFVKIEFKNNMVSLLKYIEPNGQIHLFLQKDTNVPEELLKKCEPVNGSVSCKNVYWTTVRFYTNDCPSIKDSQIKATELTSEDIRRLLVKYVICKKGSIDDSQLEEGDGAGFTLSIYVAPGINNISFSGVGNAVTRLGGLSLTSFGNPISFQGGLSYETLPRLNRRFAFGAELGIKTYKSQGDVTTRVSSSSSNFRQQYDLSFFYAKLAPSLKYNLSLNSSWHPYLRAGIGVNYSLSFSSTYKQTEFRDSGTTATSQEEAIYPNEFLKTELIFFGGAGVSKSKFRIELRAERGSGVLENLISYSSSTLNTSLFLSYLIVQK